MLNGAVQSAGLDSWWMMFCPWKALAFSNPAPRSMTSWVKSWASPKRGFVCFISGWDAAEPGYGFQPSGWSAGDPMDNLPAKPNFELDDLTLIPDLAAR